MHFSPYFNFPICLVLFGHKPIFALPRKDIDDDYVWWMIIKGLWHTNWTNSQWPFYLPQNLFKYLLLNISRRLNRLDKRLKTNKTYWKKSKKKKKIRWILSHCKHRHSHSKTLIASYRMICRFVRLDFAESFFDTLGSFWGSWAWIIAREILNTFSDDWLKASLNCEENHRIIFISFFFFLPIQRQRNEKKEKYFENKIKSQFRSIFGRNHFEIQYFYKFFHWKRKMRLKIFCKRKKKSTISKWTIEIMWKKEKKF